MDSLNTSFDKETKIWSGPKVFPVHNIEHHSIGRILFGQMRLNPRNVIQVMREAFLELSIRNGDNIQVLCRHSRVIGPKENILKVSVEGVPCFEFERSKTFF